MARVEDPNRKTDWALLRYLALAVILSCFGAYYFQPVFSKSRDAATVLATVVSILAGFLIAVMAIVGDERTLRGRNWRQDTWYLSEARRQLLRYQVMFNLYLMVLVLLFLCSLGLPWPKSVQLWAERSMLFLATFTLLMSFRLPGEVTSRQVQQLVKLIREKRDASSQADDK